MAAFDDLVKARRSLDVAESMITKTYSLSHDPKIILAVAEDVYAALLGSIRAVLSASKRKSGGDFAAVFAVFRDISARHGFDKDDLSLVEALHRVVSEHESSRVEFARKGCFVMCDARYSCKVISLGDMQKYLFRARLFVRKTEAMLRSRETSRNERIS
jgi:hypothetical protein